MEATTAIDVLIVDGDPRVRECLRSLVALDSQLRVVGEAASGADALAQAAALKPDVVLLDLELATCSSLALLGRLRGTGVPVVGLAVYPDSEVEAYASGACAYLLKDAPRQYLLAAIHAAHHGRTRS